MCVGFLGWDNFYSVFDRWDDGCPVIDVWFRAPRVLNWP